MAASHGSSRATTASSGKKMRALEDDLFPSTPGKVKIERAGGAMNRQLHRCFASTSTMFLWALFLVAMTTS